MCLTKSWLVLVVVLGALEIWTVEGMTTSRYVRPTKMVHHDGEKQHPTVKPAYDPSHSQPSIASPPAYLHHQSAQPIDYQWQSQSQHLSPTPRPSPPAYQQHQPAQPNNYQWPSQPQPLLPTPRPTVVDQYDNRYQDGSYEYRYELSDGTVRYECGYFIWFQEQRVLVVKGFYSYPLTDYRYYTVFYTADQNGYVEDSASYSLQPPVLPKSLSADLVHEDGLRNFVESEVSSFDDGHGSK